MSAVRAAASAVSMEALGGAATRPADPPAVIARAQARRRRAGRWRTAADLTDLRHRLYQQINDAPDKSMAP